MREGKWQGAARPLRTHFGFRGFRCSDVQAANHKMGGKERSKVK